MSTRPVSLFGQSEDPRQVELIRSLVDKTRQGKIPWAKQLNALTASVPNGFQVNFVLSSLSFVTPYSGSWQLLTVRNKSGNELVRVDNTSTAISILAGAQKTALIEAADELFTAANRIGGDDIERAIDAINNL